MYLLHDDHDGPVGHSELHEHVHEHTHTHTHDGTTHEHTHTHMHDHAASETHEHTHDEAELHLPNKELQTLYALLGHWVEHNLSHEKSFNEWAERADNLGKGETAKAIRDAVKLMEDANEMLRVAKEKMS